MSNIGHLRSASSNVDIGRSLVRPGKTAAAASVTDVESAARLAGVPVPAKVKTLDQRQVRRERRPVLTKKKKSATYARTTGNTRAVSAAALKLVRGGRLPTGTTTRRDLVNRHLATTNALRALGHADIDETILDARERMVMLMPFRHAPESADELFERFAKANPGEIGEMAEDLAEVDIFQRQPNTLRKALEQMRYNQTRMAAFLQHAMGLTYHPAFKDLPGSPESLLERLVEGDLSDNEFATVLKEYTDHEFTKEQLKEIRQARSNKNVMLQLLQKYHILPSAEQVREALEQATPELQEYLQQASRESLQSELHGEDLDELRQRLLDELADEEVSGEHHTIQIYLEAEEFADQFARKTVDPRDASKRGDPNEFLDAFSELLFQSSSFAGSAKQLLERFGFNNLPATVGSMKEALESKSLQDLLGNMKKSLGDEMRAIGANPDHVQLGAVVRGLSHVHVLTTLIEMTNHFVDSMEAMARAANIPAAPLDASVFLQGMVDILGSHIISTNHFESLLDSLNIPKSAIGTRINALTSMRKLMAALPEKSYPNLMDMNKRMDALAHALDKAIEDEEHQEEAALAPERK